MRLLRLFELSTGAVGGAAIPALPWPLAAQVAAICRAQVLPFVANSLHTCKRVHRYKVAPRFNLNRVAGEGGPCAEAKQQHRSERKFLLKMIRTGNR